MRPGLPPCLRGLLMSAHALLEPSLMEASFALLAMVSRQLGRSDSAALASCGDDPRKNASAANAISSSWA
eukprot:7589859-Pyramimonas_sp.AAC.1